MGTTVLTGCSSNAVPTKWQAAYQSLNLTAVNARDQKVVDCLGDNGFPGFTVVWNGGIESPPLTTEQHDIVRETIKSCQDEVNGDRLASPSDDELADRYHLEVAASQCLDDHDYFAPTPPPSLQEYIDRIGTEKQWSAFGAIADQIHSDGDLRKIASDCPDPGWFAGLPTPTEGN